MKKEEVIKRAEKLAERRLIDPYIPDVLSDGSTYADEFLIKLSVADNDESLERLIKQIMC